MVAAPLRVLYAASEAYPLIKTGGLADVGGALPTALRHVGVDARLLLPAYPGVIDTIQGAPVGGPFPILPGIAPVQLIQGVMPGGETPVYAVACAPLYERLGGPYTDPDGHDWADNVLRFGVLSRVAAAIGTRTSPAGWFPDIVHCNDWQTGLTPAYLAYAPDALARSVISVHNLAFQGNFPPYTLGLLELPPASFSLFGLEFHGYLSFLKAGLYYADRITTVSPTYAQEIQTAAFAYGMEGVLTERSSRLTGILNGIDTAQWDPAADTCLPAPYSARKLTGKAADKRALQQRLGLNTDPETPILGMVSRMTWQKGVDLVLDIVPDLMEQPVQLAILGSGDRGYEARWRELAAQMPGRIGVQIGYDERLAHLIEGGADIFLMPSRFEPCGLNQMYSMRYGTPPAVRRTGGLADSVVDTTPKTLADGTATGFVFDGANTREFIACLLRALLLQGQTAAWRKVQRNGMSLDFSWEHSARQYLDIYRQLVPEG